MEFKEFKGFFWGQSSSKYCNWAQTPPREFVVLDLCDFPRATPVWWHRKVGWVTEGWGTWVLREECVEFDLGKHLKSGTYIWMSISLKYLSTLILDLSPKSMF